MSESILQIYLKINRWMNSCLAFFPLYQSFLSTLYTDNPWVTWNLLTHIPYHTHRIRNDPYDSTHRKYENRIELQNNLIKIPRCSIEYYFLILFEELQLLTYSNSHSLLLLKQHNITWLHLIISYHFIFFLARSQINK